MPHPLAHVEGDEAVAPLTTAEQAAQTISHDVRGATRGIRRLLARVHSEIERVNPDDAAAAKTAIGAALNDMQAGSGAQMLGCLRALRDALLTIETVTGLDLSVPSDY